jgi:CheR methyltransferase, all-alpha domain.
MSVPEPTEDEFNLFRNWFRRNWVLNGGDDKKYLLYSRVQRRLTKKTVAYFPELL